MKSAELIEDNNSYCVVVSYKPVAKYDMYKVYRKTDSKWVYIGTEKHGNSEFMDLNPVLGAKNTYTVKGYNSKTKENGKYESKGVSVNVPDHYKINLDYISFESEFSFSAVRYLSKGPFTIGVNYYPSNAENKNLKWESSNPSVATVNKNGTVTPLKAGETVISAIPEEGDVDSYECSIYIYDVESMIKEAIDITNKERIKAGLVPFKTNPNLQKAAMIRAKEISVKFTHARPDGRDIATIGRETGVANIGGENIGYGYKTASSLIQGLMASPGHKIQIVDQKLTYMGLGLYIDDRNCPYWVQLFTDGDPDEKILITFNTMGGNILSPITVPRDCPVYPEDVPIPKKDGYEFDGWYRYAHYTGPFNSTMYVQSNLTLYAKWNKK